MNFKNVLVLYKQSSYNIYFLNKKSSFGRENKEFIRKEVSRFKKAHDEHYDTLKTIESVLCKYNIAYTKTYRGRKIDYKHFDLVITVGGDGTFLEAAKEMNRGVLLGVNSSTSYSVGKLCTADARNFEIVLRRTLLKKVHGRLLHRLSLDIHHCRVPIDCLNDILVCHKNPAAMSRYYLKIGKIKEEQRSSGIWVATPAGSTGAIQSAGGKRMGMTARCMQYMPRELYSDGKIRYRLRGEILSGRRKITITSLMRNGMIYVDGTHREFPFPYGTSINITLSPNPLRVIK